MIDAKTILKPEYFRKYGEDYVAELIKELKSAGKSASGKLIKSISYELQPLAENLRLVINAESYLQFVDAGRKPGRYPPIQEIAKWASIKGIPQSAVFPIARKIYKFGIKPTRVIQSTIKKMENSSKITVLERNIANNIEELISNNIETID